MNENNEELKTTDLLKYETVLPEDFNGVFNFTNWSDEDFIGVWGGKNYIFPAQSTSPMIMPESSPIEIQNIRKKFAKDLGQREFFKSKDYAPLMAQERNTDGSARLNSIQQAGTYNIDQLAPFIQKCLTPLPISKAKVEEAPKDKLEDKLSKNDDGELNTQAIDSKKSLKQKALES